MNNKTIKDNIEQAIQAVRKESRPLGFGDVHERSTAHRLAVHMEQLFEEWDVDCEYNRYGEVEIKKIAGITACNHQNEDNRVFPDIIVHKRGGRDNDNLLVIEMKNKDPDNECDFEKLKLFTDTGHFKYQLGLYVNINEGAFDCTWFKNGEEQN